LYDCYAMQRHFGKTLNGGHYTARIRVSERAAKPSDDVWLDFDDNMVSVVPPRSDGRRWQDSQRFASHLLYSVFFVRREEQMFDDDVPLVRTASCFVEDHSGTKYTGLPRQRQQQQQPGANHFAERPAVGGAPPQGGRPGRARRGV